MVGLENHVVDHIWCDLGNHMIDDEYEVV